MARSSDISPLTKVLARADAVADGAQSPDTIATGFPSLDRVLGGGMRRGDLVVLGGDVGSGKSAFGLAVALRVAQAREKVIFYSGEMSTERLLERVLAIEGRVRVDDLRQGVPNDIARASVGAAAVRMRDGLPRLDVLPPGGITELEEELEDTKADLVVVDSLQWLVRGGNTAEELAEAVRRLKKLAVARHCAILTTSQLPELAARDDRRPTLDDFGAMGAVKHHADVVLALYREDMYDRRREIEGATELLVRKNRNGSIGYVDLYFYAQWMRFEDMLDPDR